MFLNFGVSAGGGRRLIKRWVRRGVVTSAGPALGGGKQGNCPGLHATGGPAKPSYMLQPQAAEFSLQIRLTRVKNGLKYHTESTVSIIFIFQSVYFMYI